MLGIKGENSSTSIKFDDVKPICCDVMKNPSKSNLETLQQFLKKISSESLTPEIANYIVFPLVIHLKAVDKLKFKAKELLLKCIELLLSKTVLDNDQCFFELFQNLTILLGMKDNQPSMNLNLNMPDEFLSSMETGIWFLLRDLSRSRHSRVQALYNEKNVSSVGHCIFMQLQVVNSDLKLDVRLKALEIVSFLFIATSEDSELTHRVFTFIPGVAIALRKAASTKVGKMRKALVLKALEVLVSCLNVVVKIELLEELEKTDSNLSILMQQLSEELVFHDEPDLRRALAKLSIEIISSSSEKFPKCCDILWRNIRILSWDSSSPELRELCQTFLKSHPLAHSTVEDSLELLKTSYNQLLNGNIEDGEQNLKLLASNLFQNESLLFTELASLLPPLVKLFTVSTLKGLLNIGTDNEILLFRKNTFPHMCSEICKIIKDITSPPDIFEEILPFFNLNVGLNFEERLDNNFLGTVFFFNKFLDHCSIDANLVEELMYLDLPNIASLYLEILDLQIKDLPGAIPKVASALEFESVLVIEGLGVLATIDCQTVLPLVLYYLLEQAGSKSDVIVKTGSAALTKCANGLPIEKFLTNNLDLIMSELSVRTRAISSHPNCPNALVFLAKYFDFGQSEFVSCVEQAFSQSCDQFYLVSQEPFARIFYAFLYSLLNRRRGKCNSSGKLGEQNKEKSLAERLLEYQRAIGIETGDVPMVETVDEEVTDEKVPEDAEIKSEGAEDLEKILVPELQLALNICHRVLNFLPNQNDKRLQISSLECLIYGVQLLHQEENSLLPLAHKIWQNLMPRFSDTDLNVIRKSFELLRVLCKFSGSFMKKRVVEEVFPKLSALLVSLSADSERFFHKDTLYFTHTQSYKLQMVLLEGLAELCLAIELNEEELDQVVSGCLVYLKPRQHKNLREAAIKLIEVFANSNQGGVIWMKLYAHGVFDLSEEKKIPHESFTALPELQY